MKVEIPGVHYPVGSRAPRQKSEWQGTHRNVLRGQAFQRDGFVCQYCGTPVQLEDQGALNYATADHIFPRSRGGADHIENLRTACWSCNSRKRDRTTEEYRASIRGATAQQKTVRKLEEAIELGALPPEQQACISYLLDFLEATTPIHLFHFEQADEL